MSSSYDLKVKKGLPEAERTKENLARFFNVKPQSAELDSIFKGYDDARNERKMNLWGIRNQGYGLMKLGRLAGDKIEEWISQHQELYQRGYNYEMHKNDHNFLGAGEKVRSVSQTRPDYAPSIMPDEHSESGHSPDFTLPHGDDFSDISYQRTVNYLRFPL